MLVSKRPTSKFHTRTIVQLGPYFVAAVAIAASLVIGKLVFALLGLLPASLWGMLVFTALLASGLVKHRYIAKAIANYLYFMPLVFLPVCVGAMQYTDLLLAAGWKLGLVGVISALLSLLVIGRLAEFMLKQKKTQKPARS